MSNIRIIKPYKKSYRNELSLAATLHKDNRTRIPGTSISITPIQDYNGDVRTGINENAIKIRTIKDKEARDLAYEATKLKREKLEQALNEDLSPQSPFWVEKIEKPFYLKDGDNIFNLDKAEDELEYSWLMELPFIAKSLEDIQSGKVDSSTIIWYVHEPDVESNSTFNRKRKINDVVATLNKLGELELRKVAFVLNLKLSKKATYNDIYNTVDEFLHTPKEYGTSDPIEEFIKATSYNAQTLAIKVVVKELLENKFLKMRGNSVYEGDTLLAKSIEDFEMKLTEDLDMFNAYKDKIEVKKAYINEL